MAPLFALDAYTRAEQPAEGVQSPRVAQPPSRPTRPVRYWVRGVFRLRSGEEGTRTVEGMAMNDRLDEQVRRFVDHLAEDGWLFPEGRGVLVNLLGIGAEDGGLVLFGDSEFGDGNTL